MENNFQKRLIKYRTKLKIKTKRAMAERLEIKESLYSMLENGTREPSKDVLAKLFLDSGKPEEYWKYGIETEKEYIEKREEFKCLKDTFEQLVEIGILDLDREFSESVKDVILAAAIADITHILEKRKLIEELKNE